MKRAFSIAALILLTGCMLVKDFGALWNEAKPDTCLTPIAQALYHSEFMRDPAGQDMDKLARAVTMDGFNYLLLKSEPADKGGHMYRFEVHNGIFQRMRLNPAMRHPFEVDHPHAPVEVKEDTVMFEKLGPKERELIQQIAGDPTYWEIDDQTLYNVMRDPACRFEDRDLTKKE